MGAVGDFSIAYGGTVLRNWLSALRALAWVVSPLSCGIVQQGVGPRGSAGAKIEVVFEVPPCHSKETQQALLTGCWPLWFHTKCGMWEPCNCRDRENMKPFEGKHETLRVCLDKNRVRFGGQRRPYICSVILTALFP